MRLDLRDRNLAQWVLAIQRAAYAVEAELVGFDAIPPLHETLGMLQSLHERLVFLGASRHRRLAGVLAYARDGDVVDIDRLAVDPAFFRQGVGRSLVREMLVRERAAARVVVSTGLANAPAIALYHSFGFVKVAEREPSPGIHLVDLALDLRSGRDPGPEPDAGPSPAGASQP